MNFSQRKLVIAFSIIIVHLSIYLTWRFFFAPSENTEIFYWIDVAILMPYLLLPSLLILPFPNSISNTVGRLILNVEKPVLNPILSWIVPETSLYARSTSLIVLDVSIIIILLFFRALFRFSRRKNRIRRPLFLIIILLLYLNEPTIAWSVSTHGQIGAEAISFFRGTDFLNSHFEGKDDHGKWVKPGTGLTLREWILLGLEDEDDLTPSPVLEFPPPFIGRFFNHFYNPMTGQGLTLAIPDGRSSLKWAISDEDNDFGLEPTRSFYMQALTFSAAEPLRKSHFGAFYYRVGMLMHLVQDLTQAEHVRDDPHPTQYLEKYAAAQ
ncbi:MAG: hypothetical protein D6732_24510, partial [Methanobacteriota archaeon]